MNEDILNITIDFHNTYEKLSKDFDYITRENTREFDINSNNGKLMYATVEKVVGDLIKQNTELKEQNKFLMERENKLQMTEQILKGSEIDE